MLLYYQLNKLETLNTHRRSIARIYEIILRMKTGYTLVKPVEGAVYLRFPVLVSNPITYIRHAKEKGILLGNWYHNIIDPSGVVFSAIHFDPSLCLKSQLAAKHIINLPTNISEKEAHEVLQSLI